MKKAASKPKAEKTEEKAEEGPRKEGRFQAQGREDRGEGRKKAPAKKAASKPKAEKTAEAKPKTAVKTKAKTTKTGVKKNE